MYSITVSDYLEKNATPQQREMGADLADLVVEERIVEGEEIQGGLCCVRISAMTTQAFRR